MQPNSKFRHIRLLIEKGELSEASTELLILMRELKSDGFDVEDLLEKRKEIVKEASSGDPSISISDLFAKKLLQLLDNLFLRVKESKKNQEEISPEKPKQKSVLTEILERLGLKGRTSKTSPAQRFPRDSNPRQEDTVKSTKEDPPLPAEELVGAEEKYYEEANREDLPKSAEIESKDKKPPPSPPLIAKQAPHTYVNKTVEQEDIVNISLFSPEKVIRGTSFLLTAFAHLYEQAEEVEERMRKADPEASLQGAKTLNLPIRRKSSLEFYLTIENWKIEDSVQVLTWFGVPSSVEFEIHVPAAFEGTQVIGSLLIKGGKGALGRVRFNFQVEDNPSKTSSDTSFAPTNSQNIQQAFFAYAQENAEQVERHSVEMKTQGVEIIDPWKMEGEDWEIKVSDGLVASELYCLFWSQSASDSEEIQVSWQMALGHRLSHPERLPDMLPVLLEKPAPEAPSELAFLNFIHTETKQPAIKDDLSLNTAANLKSQAERFLMNGKEEAFELLYNWFQKDADMMDEILMLQTRWNTLKKKVRIRLLSEAEAQVEERQIIHACLSVIGQVN